MMSSIKNYDLERPSLLYNEPVQIKFAPEEYYLYCGFSKDIIDEFYNNQRLLLNNSIQENLITSFLNYLWGYMSINEVCESFNTTDKEFINMFFNIIDSWTCYKNSENCDYLKLLNNKNIKIQNQSKSNLIHLSLFIKCDESINKENINYNEKYKKDGIKIHLYIFNGKILYINNVDIDNIEKLNVNNFISFKELEVVFDDNFEYISKQNKIDAQLDGSIFEILCHVSRFGVFNNNRNPNECLSIFEILLYLSKRFIENGSCI